MANGFLAGLVWGVSLGLGGVVVLSALNPLDNRPDVSASVPEVAAPQSRAEQVPLSPGPGDADLVELAPTAPTSVPDEKDAPVGVEEAARRPGVVPEIGGSTALRSPSLGPNSPAIEVDIERPVAPVSPLRPPSAPNIDRDLTLSTEPAQPPAPVITDTSPRYGRPPVAPALETPPAPVPEVADMTPVPEAAPAEPAEVATIPEARTGSTTITGLGGSISPLTERADAQNGRLPTVNPSTVGQPDDATALPRVRQGPPLRRYAAAFDNPESRPLMSIVLIDDGSAGDVDALRDFPYPVTFAVDPTAPEAAAKMAAHRAAGFEVLVLADLPQGATAQDAEVTLNASFAILPETIGVLEGTRGGVQSSRAASDQVTQIVAASGRGLITQDKGLNTVQRMAQRDGVPSAVVFRDFDGAGQSPTVMRRFLDQAAFRAGQEGAVIMLGRVRPDTISAILLWGLQDRASRVALAPVSAVLQASIATSDDEES